MEQAESFCSRTNPREQLYEDCIQSQMPMRQTSIEVEGRIAGDKAPINQLWTETSTAALQELEEAINSMRDGIATIRSWCDRMSGKLDEVEGKLAQNKKRKSIWLQEDSPNTDQVVNLTETSGEDVLATLKSAKGEDKAHQRER
ncbi:uncharacterized protein LOC120643822 [Panicum virgatum]|uniref:uncharacterized protein LOC120643822 n=1 Tax=Panicum virgatum TaxID=38727 RepID=UPI0019D63B34|nr:uncharacterized protein LOC120643822 [Panicum virgatum]